MKRLLSFHDAGFKHGDLNEDNVLITSSSLPIIIDLAKTEKHQCHRDDELYEGDVAPVEWKEYGCEEIYNFGLESGYFFNRE